MKKIFLIALIASVLSLAVALMAEYGFGLKPCELCLMQRVPYVVVIVMSSFSLVKPYCPKFAAYLVAIVFIIGGTIAVYHSAVEKHFIKGPDACTSSASPATLSVDELLKKIQNAPIVACDQPAWEFHGITMAVINAVWSFFLGIMTVLLIRRGKNA